MARIAERQRKAVKKRKVCIYWLSGLREHSRRVRERKRKKERKKKKKRQERIGIKKKKQDTKKKKNRRTKGNLFLINKNRAYIRYINTEDERERERKACIYFSFPISEPTEPCWVLRTLVAIRSRYWSVNRLLHLGGGVCNCSTEA